MSDVRIKRLKVGRAIIALVGLLALVTIAVLTFSVVNEIEAQSSAQSDNVQWSLSQTEVEFQEFRGQLRIGADLSSIRRRFDVFYSRIRIVREAQVFSELRLSPNFETHLSNVEAFLETAIPLIDGSDTDLTRSLPTLNIMSQEVRPEVRALANSGLRYFAERSDEQRLQVARTLTRLAIAVLVLISALAFGIFYLNALVKKVSRREREQKQTLARINTIMSASLDGVIVSDADGRITNFNKASEIIFGYSYDEVVGQNFAEFIVPDHLRAAHDAGMKRVRERGERRVVGKGRVELEARRSDGSTFPVELAIQSATTDEGEIFIAFLRDVSARVAAEAELIAARDKAIAGEQARSEFLATMSHEIRTPLNGLLGNMSLLKDTSLNVKQTTFLKNMETSGRLLLSHVSDVLDIARYDSGKIQVRAEPFNVSDLLSDIVNSQSGMALAQNTSLDWGWQGPPQHWVMGDLERLQHVLINLIGNAVKFTKNGRVSVTVSWMFGELQVEVKDTGIGISEEMQGRVFDDFITGNTAYDREVSGTGLGLSIVKRFVNVLGGTIALESTLGEGSTFTVTVPAEPATRPEQSQKPQPDEQSVASLNILVVEDNEINRFVVRNMLEADGHKVTEAVDGRQGVEKANAYYYDVILMDISMPVLDGRRATREIRQGSGPSANSRILALTANVLPDERKDFLNCGMEDVLTKPISKDVLRAALSDAVPADAASSADLIDEAHNAETREMLGEDGYRQIHARFDEEVADFLVWATPDVELMELAKKAHKLAGSASMFGAGALAKSLRQVEAAAKVEERNAAMTHLDAARVVAVETRIALSL